MSREIGLLDSLMMSRLHSTTLQIYWVREDCFALALPFAGNETMCGRHLSGGGAFDGRCDAPFSSPALGLEV